MLFSYYYVFVSPKMIEAKKVQTTVQLFEQKNSKEVEFKSRYFLEDVYFSAFDEKTLYFFSEEGKLYFETPLSNLDEDRLNTLASEKYDNYSLAYVLIDDKPTYVIVSEKEDVFINVETFEELLVFRKGINND